MQDKIDGNLAPPQATWAFIVQSSERMARIESKLDMSLSNHSLLSLKVDALETRQNAADASKVSVGRDVEANTARILALEVQAAAFEISPAEFKNWRADVSDVVKKFKENVIAIAVKRDLTTKEKVQITGLAGALATIIVAVLQYFA